MADLLNPIFLDEELAREHLESLRWAAGRVCPHCGVVDESGAVASKNHKPGLYHCNACAKTFTVTVGTLFERSHVPLNKWLMAFHLFAASKKGISALQVQRMMGFGSYSTALNMCNKIRVALGNVEFRQLVGYVEVDETFVGGKAKNKHKGPGGRGDMGGTGPKGKQVVVGAIQRKGNVIARVVANTARATLDAFVREVVSNKVSLISTDEHHGYRHLGRTYPHGFVRHSHDEYVAGAVHTNTIEGFWSIVKRGIVGTFHKVSKKYLPLYVNEFEFRYNNRMNPDIFGAAIRAC